MNTISTFFYLSTWITVFIRVIPIFIFQQIVLKFFNNKF